MSLDPDLSATLDALASARVLVVGDIMLDRFVYGTVERISPEGPVPVLRVEREEVSLGGAGNVLRNLRALGCEAAVAGVIGEDAAGDELRRLIAEAAASQDFLVTLAERPTTIKERHVAGARQLLRADRESGHPLPEAAAAALLEAALGALADFDALVLSDYGKGALPPGLLAALIEAASTAGRPVVVDPRGRDYGDYWGASVATPNRRELEAATGLPAADDAEVAAACRELMERCGLGAVLATRSEKGMTLVASDGAVTHLPATAREVYDVTGAGDTVVAVLGAALAAGRPLAEAAQLANAAAGLAVGKLGTAAVSRTELQQALYAAPLLAAETKIVDLTSLEAQTRRWRDRGLSIGFTNGCFDLLHPGHLSLLRQARAACDRLVVGLNSDASVRRLKGDPRPLQDEAARAAVLAALGEVDRVVVFTGDTPVDLIRRLRPEVLVKGADYKIAQVVGADYVQGYGGRVLLAELLPGAGLFHDRNGQAHLGNQERFNPRAGPRCAAPTRPRGTRRSPDR
jgi:D-beta-D-heptose 7-phosphate kinase/D-beta-D-heptose 1-phosphate adenosyltransferase